VAIVKGDRLSASEKLATCELMAAGFYSWFISNQAVTDDFGRGRLAPATLWAKVFEKRIDRGLSDVTPGMVLSWFSEWERVGLVRVYVCGDEVWFEWVKFQGVPPTKQRYHRAPEPPWSAHACVHRCQRSGKKFPQTLRAVASTTADAFGSRTAAALGPYSVPSVFRSPSSPPSSVPPLPLQTDYGLHLAPPNDGGAETGEFGALDLPPDTEPEPPKPRTGRKASTKHRNPDDPWPTSEALADYEARNGAGSAPRAEVAGQLDGLVRAQAQAHGVKAGDAWTTYVRPAWRAYWGLDGKAATCTNQTPSAADFRKHFGARPGNGKAGKARPLPWDMPSLEAPAEVPLPDPDAKALELWNSVLALLERAIDANAFATWFRPTYGLEFDEGAGVLVVSVPNQSFAAQLSSYGPAVFHAAAEAGVTLTFRYAPRSAA
jgi:hypothetical protein